MNINNKEKILKQRIQVLKNTTIFSGSTEEVLIKIAQVLSEKNVTKGKIILKKGDIGNSMYILVKGKVRIHDGNHVLSRLVDGSVFGEYSLIDDEYRSATITAEEDTLLFKLSQENFYSLILKNQHILKEVLKVLINRMREMNKLEEKLAKNYLKIKTQKQEIEKLHQNILEHKQLLEEQNFDLLSLNDEKNNLVSVFIHGMKNNLTSGLSMAELLKTEMNDPKNVHFEYVNLIYNSFERMTKMINEILNLNKIESKTLQLQFEKIEISKVITDTIQHYKFPIEKKKLNINLNLVKTISILNSVYIYQIFDNLISNAIKFSFPNKYISINMQHDKHHSVLIEISDEGPGISEEIHKNLFSQYERQTDGKNKNTNTGLGLAIVKKYVEAMKGKVWCESEEGKGSNFYLEFNRVS